GRGRWLRLLGTGRSVARCAARRPRGPGGPGAGARTPAEALSCRTRPDLLSSIARMAQRKRYLFVCTNARLPGNPKGSCAQRGSVEIHAALKAALAAREMAKTEVR